MCIVWPRLLALLAIITPNGSPDVTALVWSSCSHHKSSGSKLKHRRTLQGTSIRSQIDGNHILKQQQQTSYEPQTYWKLPRLYVQSSRLAEKYVVALSPEQTHYLTNVMRFFKKRKQDAEDTSTISTSTKHCVRLFNGQDGEWLAKVIAPIEDNTKQRKRQRNDAPLEAECILQLRKQQCSDEEQPWIIMAPLKNQSRMKLLIEKCTELGVGRIILAKSDRMDGSVLSSMSTAATIAPSNDSSNELMDNVYGKSREEDNVSMDKLRIQAIEASEQCERLSIPLITTDVSSLIDAQDAAAVLSVKDIVKLWSADEKQKGIDSKKLLICRERGEQSTNVVPILDALRERDTKTVVFVVGPEGGWSAEEEALFDEVCLQSDGDEKLIQCVSLGSSVLRAETACMMAVGAWSLVCD
jgi:16S rRNA (uracil1498-N3)-methyltransferase